MHSHTALLVMDIQPAIIDNAQDKDAFLARTEKAIATARSKGVRVIFVVVGFREGYPEAPIATNKVFGHLRERNPSVMVHPQPLIEIQEHDIVVVKKRVSAFAGSDLDIILRAQQITDIVVTGIMTSGVVLSTVREAADKDYNITVLSDLCADPKPDVHQILMEKVFPWQAEVTTSEEWMASIG